MPRPPAELCIRFLVYNRTKGPTKLLESAIGNWVISVHIHHRHSYEFVHTQSAFADTRIHDSSLSQFMQLELRLSQLKP